MQKVVPALAALIGLIPGSYAADGKALSNAAEVAAQIDRAIAAKLAAAKLRTSPDADDAEFVRRVYLDLNGVIPTADEARAFLDARDSDKRARLIDERLADPRYGRHFGGIWTVLSTPRDANMIRQPDTKPLARWLSERFQQNQPWNELVADILTADGAIDKNPPAVFFVLNGDSRGVPQANILMRNAGPLFMGQQIQCAECHNHPFTSWKQDDFWGMAAFFGRVGGKGGQVTEAPPKVTAGKKPSPPSIAISAEAFKNVGKMVPAHLPGGGEPAFGDAASLRPPFAAWLTSPENRYFARAATNRLWAHCFGRGIVNPLGDMSEGNAPSHPELLDCLTKEFIASGFDQKHLLRCITLSRTYQRTSKPTPDNRDDDQAFARMNIKVLSPDMMWDSLCIALEIDDLSPPVVKGVKRPSNGTLAPAQTAREQFAAFFSTKDDGGDATEFTHGIPQALRLMNQEVFNRGGKAVERLVSTAATTEQAIEGLYLAALSRGPSASEAKEALAFATRAGDPLEGCRGIFWALINSSEFALNR